MCIISTIMESCPSASSFYSSAASKAPHNGLSNIIRLFLKKGLVSDLARVPHSLDLSRCCLDAGDLGGVGNRALGSLDPWGSWEVSMRWGLLGVWRGEVLDSRGCGRWGRWRLKH